MPPARRISSTTSSATRRSAPSPPSCRPRSLTTTDAPRGRARARRAARGPARHRSRRRPGRRSRSWARRYRCRPAEQLFRFCGRGGRVSVERPPAAAPSAIAGRHASRSAAAGAGRAAVDRRRRRSSSTRRRAARRSGPDGRACRPRCWPPAASTPDVVRQLAPAAAGSRGATSRSRATGRSPPTRSVLPPSVRRLIDRDSVAGGLDSPRRRSPWPAADGAIDDAPALFGTIRPGACSPPPTRRTRRRPSRRRARHAGHGRPSRADRADGGRRRRRGLRPPAVEPGRRRRSRRTAASAVAEPGRGSGVAAVRPGRRADPRRTARPGAGRRGRGATHTGRCARGHRPTSRRPGRDVSRVGRAPAALPARLVHGARGRPAPIGGAGRRRMPDGLALRRSLARLGLGLTRCRRQRQGDDIDIDAAVEARVDALAGSPHDDDFYVESLRRRATSPSWSCSTSRARPASPAPPGKTVHEHQRSAAAALTAALHDLGDRVALYAFNSRGRTGGAGAAGQGVRRPPRRRRGPAARRPGARAPTRGSAPPSATARRSSRSEAGRPGGCSSCCPTASPTTTATRVATARPTPGGPSSRPAAAAWAASASASAPTPSRRRCGGCSARRPTPRCPRAEQLPGADRSAVPRRAAVGGSPAALVPTQGANERASRDREEDAMTQRLGPFYVPVGDEEQVFKAAFRQRLSVVLKGPTGCGKTRFVEAMAHDLDRPLITVSCHDDLTTADLVGRYLLEGGETRWVDGPLTRAVREGAICYLDEVVEARQDTTVVIHPLADHRRQLPIDRLGRPRRRAGVLPRRVVQPRLPERAQGPEGLDPPADGRHRARLPAARRRGEDRRPRGRRRPRRRGAARAARPGDPAARDRRAPRGGLDPRADRRRAARRRGPPARRGRPGRGRRAPHRRPGRRRRPARDDRDLPAAATSTRIGIGRAEQELVRTEGACRTRAPPSRSSSATCSTSSSPTASRRRCGTT